MGTVAAFFAPSATAFQLRTCAGLLRYGEGVRNQFLANRKLNIDADEHSVTPESASYC